MSPIALNSLLFTGRDHRTFLQRMFTHDMLQLPEGAFRFAALCTAKGRVIANGLFISEGENTRLILPADQLDIVKETLLRFRLRDQVDIQPDGSCWALHWQSQGEYQGEGVLSALFLSPSNEAQAWMTAACEAGLAMITAADREKHVPQTLNMDLAEGISFSKGCYPGQEVVARLHYLGKPKNRTMHATADGPVSIGDKVYSDPQATEHIGSCILVGDGGHLLCTCKTANMATAQASQLTVGGEKYTLTPAPVPYELQAD